MWKYMKRGLAVLGLCTTGTLGAALDALPRNEGVNATYIGTNCSLVGGIIPINQTAYIGVSGRQGLYYVMEYAGGTAYENGAIAEAIGRDGTKAIITEEFLADCFNTQIQNIKNLTQNGADAASLAEEDYLGFSFTFNGTYYEYALEGATNTQLKIIIRASAPDLYPIIKPRLQNMLSANANMVKQAKTRFIASQSNTADAMNFLPGRNSVPLTYDATLSADSTRITSRGNFFTQQGSYDGKSRQVVFGDFSVVGEKDGSVTGTLSSRIARERHISDQTMMGYFLGVEVSHTDIYSTFTGKNRGYDLIMGGYFVNELTDNVFVDGFVSVGTGNNLLEMSNDEMSLEGIYQTRSGSIGGALTGVYDMGTYEFWPELSFAVGKTKTLKKNFTETSSGNVNNNPTVDADDTTIAKLTVRPEMRRDLEDEYMSSGYTSQLTMAPRLICEWVTTDRRTQDCGSGAEVGLMRRSYDGLSQFTATISRDYVGSSGRTGLEFKFEKRF